MSSAPLVFYWGMKGSFPQLDVHNILFSTDYKKEFDELFNENKAPIDPTIYINITSKVVPTDAPEGHENWFVMINVPPRDKKDNWFEKREQLRKLIIQKIQDRLGINVLDHLVFEDSLDPYTLEKSNGAYRGSIYGNRSVGAWSMFKRQPNQSPINGLYFVGGTVHPGGGIPLVLSSAKVTANLILDKDS
jgi:phytoene dehydrogenase-like protein